MYRRLKGFLFNDFFNVLCHNFINVWVCHNFPRAVDYGYVTLLDLFDFSKAFDTISHSKMLTKFVCHCGYSFLALSPAICRFCAQYRSSKDSDVRVSFALAIDMT